MYRLLTVIVPVMPRSGSGTLMIQDRPSRKAGGRTGEIAETLVKDNRISARRKPLVF
jgi:hypothetical protein